jgi:hypothetical protein
LSDDLLLFVREHAGDRVLVALNFGAEPATANLEAEGLWGRPFAVTSRRWGWWAARCSQVGSERRDGDRFILIVREQIFLFPIWGHSIFCFDEALNALMCDFNDQQMSRQRESGLIAYGMEAFLFGTSELLLGVNDLVDAFANSAGEWQGSQIRDAATTVTEILACARLVETEARILVIQVALNPQRLAICRRRSRRTRG